MAIVPMAILHRDAALQVVFGKAFLVALERHDPASATLFARAFLSQTPHEVVRLCEILT